jgi:hypothetical protein
VLPGRALSFHSLGSSKVDRDVTDERPLAVFVSLNDRRSQQVSDIRQTYIGGPNMMLDIRAAAFPGGDARVECTGYFCRNFAISRAYSRRSFPLLRNLTVLIVTPTPPLSPPPRKLQENHAVNRGVPHRESTQASNTGPCVDKPRGSP